MGERRNGDNQAPPLRAQLLGAVRLVVGDRPIADDAWPRRTARALLLLLLATPGHRLPRDRAIDLLWPETGAEAALNAFYLALGALRRVLEPGLRSGRDSAYVEVGRELIRLRPEPGLWVDVDTFTAALARADAGPPTERAGPLREALALYEGDLLADEPYIDWPVAQRETLRQAWRRALLTLAELDREAGRAGATVPALERLVAGDPSDETALRSLMRSLAADGQRDEALRRFERATAALRCELEAEPAEETTKLATEIRTTPAKTQALAPLAKQRLENIPAPPTPMVGRSRELEALQDLLLDPDVRLVTVIGPGGIGKTRLAIEIARQVADDFADGVCFVPLAAVREPELVLSAIASAVGVAESPERSIGESLRGALRERELLLVLDNLEQVLPAATDIAELLEGCPELTMLATSREPLALRAEHLYPAPALTVPPRDREREIIDAAAASRYEAVALFSQRIRAVRPGWRLSDAEAPIVAAVCARLDGLPLAIELAAAHGRTRTIAELQSGLEDRFALLASGYRDLPARQRTMRDAVAWSYDLLSPDEQIHFRRLAVFSGGATLNAIEWVLGVGPSVRGRDDVAGDIKHPAPSTHNLISALVARSLVRVDESGSASRFDMLETIRDYGLEQLTAAGEEAVIRRRHAAYYRELAERGEPALTGPDQLEWFERLELEHDNIRATLTWAFATDDGETAAVIAASIWRFWLGRGHIVEGTSWLTRILDRWPDLPAAPRAAAVAAAARLGDHANAAERVGALYQEALELWTALGNRREMAYALDGLGNVARDQGDYERATAYHEQSLAIHHDIDNRRGAATSSNNLGAVAYFKGDYDRADAWWQQALAITREIGDSRSEAMLLSNLGALALQLRDLPRAIALQEESLARHRRIGDLHGIASALANLGGALHEAGDDSRAISLLDEAVVLFREQGDTPFTGLALINLATVLRGRDEPARAIGTAREAIALFHSAGDRFRTTGSLEILAGLLVADCPERAARLFGAAAALRETIGAPREASEQAAYEEDLAAAQAVLGNAFTPSWETGRSLSEDEAVAEALAAPH